MVYVQQPKHSVPAQNGKAKGKGQLQPKAAVNKKVAEIAAGRENNNNEGSLERKFKNALEVSDSNITRDFSDQTSQNLESSLANANQIQLNRPLSEYEPEKNIVSACQAALESHSKTGSKPKLHLVVLGHVDAGKSTLMGRLMYELGLIDDRTLHKSKKEAAAIGKSSFVWAWALDERPEERSRGITVDVAVAHFETPQRDIVLLDAPGHRDFVPNMIGGASQANAALLVVDGSPGGFESGFALPELGNPHGGGQTREHAQLARSLGIEQIAVVITKLDECEFSPERFEEIKVQLAPYLQKCGFKDSSIQWLPAIGPTGENLKEKPKDSRLASWWSGPTVVEAIDNFVPSHRLIEKPFRMPVSEVVVRTVGKSGSTAGGKLEGGAICPGTKVMIMPGREIGIVKSVEMRGKAVPVAMAGDNADVVLSGIEQGSINAGAVLCHPEYPVPLASRFEARVVVLEVPIPVLRGQQVTIHSHAARSDGTISKLVSLLDSKTGDTIRLNPRCLLKGQTAIVEITPNRPMPVEKYADYQALGRVALRDQGKTLAVGVITSIVV